MEKEFSSKMVSIIFAGIFFCVIFVGVVDGAYVVERNNVTVTSTETEIIEGTYTDKWRNRIFHIENGENEIIATVWGSNDNNTWVYWDSTIIEPEKNDNIVMGRNHWWYIKLTGTTTGPTTTSIVNALLTYHINE